MTMQSASTELRLVAAAVGTHTQVAGERIEALADAVSDWDVVFEIANAHAAEAHLHRHLVDGGISVPESARARLVDEQLVTAKRGFYLAMELARIVETAQQRDVPLIPYKGPILAQMAYGDVTARQYGDLDFIVRRADLPAVVDTFETMGYSLVRNWSMSVEEIKRGTSVIRPPSEFSFYREHDGTHVEVRWLFGSKHRPVDYGFELLWARRRPVSILGSTVWTLSPEDSLVVLARHGAKHAWGRLGWLADLARLVASCELDWDAVDDRARAASAERDLLLGLRLLDEWSDVELPASRLRAAHADRRIDWLTGRLERRLVAHPTMPCYEMSVNDRFLFDLLLSTDVLTLARVLTSVAFRPSESDYDWQPLPRRLHSLYYLSRAVRVPAEVGRDLGRSRGDRPQ